MTKTKIEWCESTWNPVTGCLHGCGYCYARKIAKRFEGVWDGEANGILYSFEDINITNKYQDLKYCVGNDKNGKPKLINAPYPYGFKPTLHWHRLEAGLKRYKNPRTIFVGSMCDLFGNWVPDSWINEVFRACELAPQHTYLFLTKNPKRYQNLIKQGMLPPEHWYGNTYTGESGEIRYLPNKYKQFISIEPLLAPFEYSQGYPWIIIGAESGNRKDKVIPHQEWIRKIVNSTGVRNNYAKIFMKNSLIPIIGEENMRRELPKWDKFL